MGAMAAAYPIATAAVAGAAGTVVAGELTKQKPASVAAPVVTPPTAMPDEKGVKRAAQRASIQEQLRRRGRASTILTNTDTETLGG